MASIITTKANHFRYATRFLSSHLLRYITPSSSFHHTHLVGTRGYGNGSLTLCQRFLSSAAGGANVNQEKLASDNGTNDDSGKGKESEGEQDQKSDAGKSVRGGPISWLSFLLLVVTGAGLVLYYDREKKRHIQEIHTASEAVKQGPSAGKAAIGGPFRLINHDGKYVTEKDFFGNWTLLYFGFTHCPDICPDELQKLAAAVDKIKAKAGIEIVPVFISVDPERDTVEQVGEYVKEFHPKLIGLTGSVDEVKSVARAYRVYYMKTAEEDSDYLVDHSIVIYLMDPDMGFVKFFGKNNDVDSLTDGVIKEIKQYKK
ncbi:PREDICTED: protein SCO1 homolog 1, mitochondrial isoform X2 [Lupinus angustifolius]|uniref:protein SCO1 homolog 1, mitochondrial isoform X2 n=1 Tax=Lupinus angustifolius TaxID=3871 RepID=UPI00092F12D3|nr:PREDICTED: protein SCO1 homolog 1, mitochondrial isoform X2 [Lupinus angustifolius]